LRRAFHAPGGGLSRIRSSVDEADFDWKAASDAEKVETLDVPASAALGGAILASRQIV